MKQNIYTIKENRCIAADTYRMVLQGDTSANTRPGQFVNISIPELYLRRPISVCDCSSEAFTLLYKVVGRGSEALSEMKPGVELDLLTGLGNGFDISKAGKKPLLIGGGLGSAPMHAVAKAIKAADPDAEITVVLGFNKADEIVLVKEFEELGVRLQVATLDGSVGTRGFVTDVMKDLDYTYFFSCGPGPMTKALEATAKGSGQYSLEERMGCGFGACMGCSIMTKSGSKRVCKDGPVFEREEIIW